MAAVGSIDVDLLSEALSTTFMENFERQVILPGLLDRQYESQMQNSLKVDIPVDNSTYTTVIGDYGRDDDAIWQNPTYVASTLDHITLMWSKYYNWGRKLLPDQVTDTVVDVISNMVMRQSENLALTIDEHLYNNLLSNSFVDAANRSAAYSFGTSTNYLNFTGAQFGRIQGATASNEVQGLVWNAFRYMANVIDRANRGGMNSATNISWYCITAPEVLDSINLYFLEKGSDPARDSVLINGRNYDTIMDIPIVTSNLVTQSKRTASNPDVASASGKNFVPMIFVSRKANTFGVQNFGLRVFSPTTNQSERVWKWDDMTRFYHAPIDTSLMYRAWVRTEA